MTAAPKKMSRNSEVKSSSESDLDMPSSNNDSVNEDRLFVRLSNFMSSILNVSTQPSEVKRAPNQEQPPSLQQPFNTSSSNQASTLSYNLEPPPNPNQVLQQHPFQYHSTHHPLPIPTPYFATSSAYQQAYTTPTPPLQAQPTSTSLSASYQIFF